MGLSVRRLFFVDRRRALKNRSAAPASPPCFRRWRRSSSLQSAPLLFESTRLCESDICAKENRQCISTPAVFSWARVDYASRASKKAPQGPFCRRDVWRRPMLFESTLAALYKLPDKTETPVSLQHWSSWWARVDYASRAAKNSLADCFCPAGRKAAGLTSCACRFFCNPLAGP